MTIPPPYGDHPPRPPEPFHPGGPAPGPVGYPGYPAYSGHPGYPGHPPPPGTNAMAILSLICAFVFFPLGIVFGHISLSQLKRRHEGGRGLAVAGLIISYVVAVLTVLAIVASIVFASFLVRVLDDLERDRSYSGPLITAAPDADIPPLPRFTPPTTLGSNCQYPATTEQASKPVNPPRPGRVPTAPATVGATIVTDHGSIGLELDNAKAPCTVNNFVSLAQQGYFDQTPCHRLTTSAALSTLQCGDPTGSGTGGPGYRFPNEYPTNQFRLADPALETPVRYPRGTLAMANTGPGTNGSQFFIVYADSQLPPSYTVFGSIDETGLAAVDEIAAGGVRDGADDGEPVTTVTVREIRLD